MTRHRLTPWFDALDGAVSPEPAMPATRAESTSAWVRFDSPDPWPLDRTPDGSPLSLVVPESYEPNYAYPLVVWLHGRGRSHSRVRDLAPRISDRNFLFLGLAGTRNDAAIPHLRRWHSDDVTDWLPNLHDTLCEVRRRYHVHSERILLAGEDEGATMAVRLLLRRPEWFAGAIGWNASLPERELGRFREVKGKRVLLATGAENGLAPALRTAITARVLRGAGLDVTQRTYDGSDAMSPEMLSDANHWLVETACAVV